MLVEVVGIEVVGIIKGATVLAVFPGPQGFALRLAAVLGVVVGRSVVGGKGAAGLSILVGPKTIG